MKFKTIEFLHILIICSCIFFTFQNSIDLYIPIDQGLDPINSTYKIHLDKKISEYNTYFIFEITMESPVDYTPLFIISKDDDKCLNNRLNIGGKTDVSSYFFITRDQLPESGFFYMCVIAEEKSSKFNVKTYNENEVKIPINTQVSYYVDNSNTKMKFSFQSDKRTTLNIWAKGQNIKSVKDNSNNFNSAIFDYGYVLYGQVSQNNYDIEIEGQIGDYITVGSISFNEGKAEIRIEENAKEITALVTNNEEKCFPIIFESEYFMNIVGKIYTNKALTYYKDEQGNIIDMTKTEITNGIISDLNALALFEEDYGDEGQFCLKNTESNNGLIIFSLQMTSNRKEQFVHSPMILGEIYHHYLFENEIAIFYGMKPKNTAKEVNLNIKAFKGFPEMYFDECTNFPNCIYSQESLKDKINPFPSNRMTVYSFYIDEESEEYKTYSPISSFQPLMIVFCKKGGKTEDIGISFCEFDTSYFTNEDTINIYEGSTFSQYLLDGETDNYKINLQNENDIQKIYLNLLLFSGDVDLTINGNIGQNSNKHYLSNKLFYDINVGSNDKNVKFEIKALKKSFYMIQYQLIKKGEVSKNINTLESGVNYITSVQISKDGEETEIIELFNYKFEYEIPYLVTFYSPNSQFVANRILSNKEEEEISFMENFGQMVIEKNDDYNHEKYKFQINITTYDENTDSNKLYMIYVAGLELDNDRTISLSEGVPHRFVFTSKYSSIRYAYHISDYFNTLVMNFQLIDKSNYDVKIYIGRTYLKSQNIYRDGQIFIMNTEFLGKCEDLEVCTVIVLIENQLKTGENKRMEFSMYQVEGTPLYLEKNVMKTDILHGNKAKHYYLDIYKEEYGDITLNFKRGSGNIYASIQKINLEKPMDFPDWRGLYRFPMDNDGSLKFAAYNKKIIFNTESTKDCTEGCYVLISVINNLYLDDGFIDDSTPYRISIIPRIISSNGDIAAANPKIKIEPDEFIIGDIDMLTNSERKYDYYEINIPYDSEYIYIDWQADNPAFLINIGKMRPTLEDEESYHYKSGNIGEDYVYRFDKEDILKQINSTDNSVENLNLTIGVYSNHMDSILSSPYAFKIFMAPKDFNLIYVRSDQKVQCMPIEIQNEYICYFAVIFDEMDINSNLITYPRSQNGEDFEIYGNLFDSVKIEQNDISAISSYFRQIKGNSEYKINKKYIYINDIPENKVYLFMTVSDSKSDIEVLSSTYYYNDETNFYPNPSTPQIFAIGKHLIKLNFQTTQDLLLNIVSISGEGHFNWNTTIESENQKYYLSGFEDRLTLTTYTKDDESKLSSLMIDSTDTTLSSDDNSGFIFYITYYPRNSDFSLDQIRQGRTIEINYRTANFPLFFYAPISNYNSYLINFDFYNFKIENNEIISYDNNLFNIWGTIVEADDINNARFNPASRPKFDEKNCIKGVVDSAFGNLVLDEKDLQKFEEKNRPTLYFGIENLINETVINIGLELGLYSSFVTSGLEKAVPENIYLNGDFKNQEIKRNSYLLNYDKNNPYLRIEFSAVSDSIKWAINIDPVSEQNDSTIGQISSEKLNGRILITVILNDNFFNSKHNLYFTIFTKEKLDSKLGHYVFKYLNTKENSEFFPITFKDDTVSYTKSNSTGKMNYIVNFKPIQQKDLTYYIKAVYKKSKVKNENIDSIAISESPGRFLQVNEVNNNQPYLSFVLEDLEEEISYIKVLAKITIKSQKIFLLYAPLNFDASDSGGSTDKDNNTSVYIGVGIGVFLVVVIVVLVLVIIFNMRKSKDLLDRVNKISFAESKGEKADDNLLINNDNELD